MPENEICVFETADEKFVVVYIEDCPGMYEYEHPCVLTQVVNYENVFDTYEEADVFSREWMVKLEAEEGIELELGLTGYRSDKVTLEDLNKRRKPNES